MLIYSVDAPYRPMRERFMWQQMEQVTEAGHLLTMEMEPDAKIAQKEEAMRAHDALVVEFDQPDTELEGLIEKAHFLGKGVLLFMPRQANPDLLLPTFAPHPRKPEDRNRPLHAYWLNKRDIIGNEIAVHSSGMRPMKLKIWLASQAMRLGESRPELNQEFQVVTPDNKRHGAELDQLPMFDN